MFNENFLCFVLCSFTSIFSTQLSEDGYIHISPSSPLTHHSGPMLLPSLSVLDTRQRESPGWGRKGLGGVGSAMSESLGGEMGSAGPISPRINDRGRARASSALNRWAWGPPALKVFGSHPLQQGQARKGESFLAPASLYPSPAKGSLVWLWDEQR